MSNLKSIVLALRDTRAIAAASIVALVACRARPALLSSAPVPLIASAQQLVVVTTPSWTSTRGSLWRFSRASSAAPWRRDSGPIPTVVGRTGLAWGAGFDREGSDGGFDPHKHEGDGKSPAGAFPLDTVFGYAPASAMSSLRMPYVQLTSATDCVDDTASVHYNTVVNRDVIPRVDWTSAEHMRSVWEYEMGVIVGYNAAPPTKGRGSCIFLHIWAGPDSHTAGCTAFDATELARLIEWLDEQRKPTLVQLPAAAYAVLRSRWGLPDLATTGSGTK